MVLPVDTSGITGIKTLRDFNVENAAKNQALTEGDLKNANAANLYRTQVLTGAVASGDQGIYDQARAHLADRGIDVSDLAPDINTGSQQVTAMRQAQYSSNPLNAMLGLGLRAEGNLNGATTALGDGSKAAALDPISAGIAARMAGGLPGGIGAIRPPSLPAAPARLDGAAPSRGEPMPAPGAVAQALDGLAAPQQQPAPAAAPAAAGGGYAPFSFRPQNPLETASSYQAAMNAALQQWKENPQTIHAQESAKTSGTDAGKLELEAANSQEITDRLRENVRKLLDINDKTPDSSWMDPENKAYFSKRYGSGANASNVAQWHQIDQQQILSDYGQLVKSGAIKGSRQIFEALQTGSGIPVDMPKEARTQLLNNLWSEIANKNVTTQNVNAKLNGGAAQSYEPIGLKQPPPEMIAKLKENPALRDQFDAAYGAGASRMVLGK